MNKFNPNITIGLRVIVKDNYEDYNQYDRLVVTQVDPFDPNGMYYFAKKESDLANEDAGHWWCEEEFYPVEVEKTKEPNLDEQVRKINELGSLLRLVRPVLPDAGIFNSSERQLEESIWSDSELDYIKRIIKAQIEKW